MSDRAANHDDIAELFRETGRGRLDAVQRIIGFRPELARARDDGGLSILRFAAYIGDQAILRALIEAGPPLDIFEAAALDCDDAVRAHVTADPALARARDVHRGVTPLHDAASAGALRAIDALIAAGAVVDAAARDATRRTPLIAACASGGIEACRALLRAGADPDARDAAGTTPLMIAARANDRVLAELLVARNANHDAQDRDGHTAADLAAASGNHELAARLRLGERIIDRKST